MSRSFCRGGRRCWSSRWAFITFGSKKSVETSEPVSANECGWRIHPVTCIKPLKFEKVMRTQLRASGMVSLRASKAFGIGTAVRAWRQPPGTIEEGRMTKADLIDEVSRLAELTRKDSEVIVEAIFDSVVRSLRAGDKIEIRGFGSFRTRQRKPRVGRNPKTGERVEVPAKKIPFFKPSKELKDLVNEGITDPAAASSLPPAAQPSSGGAPHNPQH